MKLDFNHIPEKRQTEFLEVVDQTRLGLNIEFYRIGKTIRVILSMPSKYDINIEKVTLAGLASRDIDIPLEMENLTVIPRNEEIVG